MGGRGGLYRRIRYSDGHSVYVGKDTPDDQVEILREVFSEDEPKPEEEQYHQFDDKAAYSHGYYGDGREQQEWFKQNSNIEEIIGTLSYSDKRAMKDWASGYFMFGQQYRGWDRMTTTEKEYTQRYDEILDRSVLTKGVTVVRRTTAELVMGRGIKTASLDQLRAMEGRIVTSRGNMSTGAAAEGLTIGDGSKRHEFRISIPAGSRGAGMWIGDKRVNPGWGADQREFITNRDISLRVGSTRYDSGRDVYVTDLVFVGRQEHDYGRSGKVF